MKIQLTTLLISLLSLNTTLACGSKKIVSVQIERTTCYGKCPAYRLGVNKNGSLGYEGKRFVKKEGFYEAEVGEDEVADIFQDIKSLPLKEYQEKYDRGMTDVPSLIITFTQKNGKEQKITIRSGGPEELIQLANKVDRYLEADWKPITSIEQKQNEE